eukprot:1756_1
MKLSKEQVDLLKSLSTDYEKGLPSSDIGESEYNIIPAPLNCPQWACIILPCINHLPSMKLYKVIKPTEAEVRKDSKWVIYDAASITKGDIIRISDGDIVPADVVVLSLGMDFARVPEEGEEDGDSDDQGPGIFTEEIVVDSSNVNGYSKTQNVSVSSTNAIIARTELYAGSMILQGTCMAVVTKTGSDTLLGTLIKEGNWPPKRQ